MSLAELQPPFLIFPDQTGVFFVFRHPWNPGGSLAEAEALARDRHGWVAGGFQYARAEGPAPGWWSAFPDPWVVDRTQLEAWADAGPVLTSQPTPQVSFSAYQKSYGLVRQALQAGLSYQVNLTFPLEGRAVSGGAWSWRSALRLWLDLIAAQGREASFAVLTSEDGVGPVLVSASPELFFQIDGDVVEARPMKGTALRHDDPGLDAASRHELSISPKTRAENLMITDLLRNDLGRLARAGGVSVPRLFEVEEYPTVWQMTSTVRAELVGEPRLVDLMTALFPCASITGAPKLSTQDVIAVAEPQGRNWYTGTLGWFRPASVLGGAARGRFSVLIRTLEFASVAEGTFRLGVGGGVVWDSTAEGEWAEAWAKARFLGFTHRTFSLTEAILWTPAEGFTLMDEHRARLRQACYEWGGTLDEPALEAALAASVASLKSGGSGTWKIRVRIDPQFHVQVEAEPLAAMPDVLTLALADAPLGPDTLLLRRFKTSERKVYDGARVPGFDQTLHVNERGELTETTSMNLVIERGGEFLTPALSCGLLPGTFRARLLAEGKVREAILTPSDLENCDQIWLVNSVRGWKKAALAGGRRSVPLPEMGMPNRITSSSS